MIEKHNDKYKVTEDFEGNLLKLTLILKEEYEDKDYDRYSICKVIEENGEIECIPLYDETFTQKQYDKFFDNPTYYIAVILEPNDILKGE